MNVLNLNRDTQTALAKDPGTPAKVLAALSKAGDYNTKALVAANPSVTAAVLNTLAKERERGVLAAVAGSKNATPKILAVLVGDSHPAVRDAAMQNPKTPINAIKKMIEKETNPDCLQKISLALANRATS